jgi:hypothetical protein
MGRKWHQTSRETYISLRKGERESWYRYSSFLCIRELYHQLKRVEFVSNRMPYIIIKGRWCHIVVLNVHVPNENIIDYVKNCFYEELERVFDKLPKYNMKIRFLAKVKEKLAHRFHMERFSLKKLSEVEGKEKYRVEVSNRFVALEDLDAELDINSAWETLKIIRSKETSQSAVIAGSLPSKRV